MDVGGWLRGLSLGKYEAAFRDNGIDEQVLPHVTAEDLREIGVATVPGSSFYRDPRDGARQVRFAFCKKTETLDAAAEKLKKLSRR